MIVECIGCGEDYLTEADNVTFYNDNEGGHWLCSKCKKQLLRYGEETKGAVNNGCSIKEVGKMKGRIKPGIIKWPDDQDIIFDIELVGANLRKCTAPGFGRRGDYGNGAIYVSDPDNIEVIKDEKTENGTLKCSICGGNMEQVWNHETRSFKWRCEDCYDPSTLDGLDSQTIEANLLFALLEEMEKMNTTLGVIANRLDYADRRGD